MYTIFPCVAATSIVVPTPQSHGMKKLPVCTAKLPSSFISYAYFPQARWLQGFVCRATIPGTLFCSFFVCVCVCIPHVLYLKSFSYAFSFCACMSLNNLFHTKKKKVKKAVLHNLRYDYCSVDGVAYVNIHSCRVHKDVIFGKAAIAVAVGCGSKCALVFLVFRHLGAHATMTQWLYTQDYANCCGYRLFSRFSSLWPKYKEEKKIGTPE